MCDRARFGFFTMLTLVLLRLSIGWHFFCEGSSHLTDPAWSSEGFLRAAKGPLAPRYHALLPDSHQWQEAIYDAGSKDKDAIKAAAKRVNEQFEGYVHDFIERYTLNEDQSAQAKEILRRRQVQLNEWLDENQKALEDHLHESQRLGEARDDISADDVPFKKKRISDAAAALKKEMSRWHSQLRGIQAAYHAELTALLEPSQAAAAAADAPGATLRKVDGFMAWGITAVGACLILGLFTRLASVAGAAFLLSVVLSQPFWIADAQPTYNQSVEMFALLALATTPVGRWGGLDFFIHSLLRCCCGAKGTSHESQS